MYYDKIQFNVPVLHNKTSIGTGSAYYLKIDTVLWKFKKKIKSSWPDCDKVDVEERDK